MRRAVLVVFSTLRRWSVLCVVMLLWRVPVRGLRLCSRSRSGVCVGRVAAMSTNAATQTGTVIVLTGPTSVGKSAVSMKLCEMLNAEIVISDSVQVYRGMNVGANKPTAEDQRQVPHHLIDLCDPSTVMTTADYAEKAEVAIRDIISRNKTPIVVGGATMWTQWLVHGRPDAPAASEFARTEAGRLIDEFEHARNWDTALRELEARDPARAAKIPRNDWYRLRRYLEVAIDVQLKAAAQTDNESNQLGSQLTGERAYQYLKGLDVRCFFLTEGREFLYDTIDRRCEEMLFAGLFQEVHSLLHRHALLPEFPVSRSIGYRQAIEFFLNPKPSSTVSDSDYEHAFGFFIREFGTATRNYAKKQSNWYKRDKKFLFVKALRSPRGALPTNYSRDKSPVENAAHEILHWVNAPATDYERTIEQQLAATQYFQRHHQNTLFTDQVAENPLEYRVMDWLLSANALTLRSSRQNIDNQPIEIEVGSRSRKRRPQGLDRRDQQINEWRWCNQHVVEHHQTSWSAEELDARTGDIRDQYKNMKKFSSKLVSGDLERFRPIFNEACDLKRSLWETDTELLEAFKEKWAEKIEQNDLDV